MAIVLLMPTMLVRTLYRLDNEVELIYLRNKTMKQQKIRHEWANSSCAVIVAHPDDEILWAGGTILMYPEANWTVITLCRKSDQDRAPKFCRALDNLNAIGAMGDLDDGPEQLPLAAHEVQDSILGILPSDRFDLIITHGFWGEYTRHLRHEETGRAVMDLWKSERLCAKEIWRFAYEDGGGQYIPRPVQGADIYFELTEEIWQRKYNIVTEVYGFSPDSFEAKTTPRQEAFWRVRDDDTIQAT